MSKKKNTPKACPPRAENKKNINKILIIILLLIIIAIAGYFLLFSEFFKIKKININNNNFKKDILDIIQQDLGKKNIFFIPVNNIKKNILNISPEIESVVINKTMPDLLDIDIIKYEKVGIWCQLIEAEISKCFDIDKNGVIYQEAPIISSSLILSIHDSRDKIFNIKDKVIYRDMLNFILLTKNNLLNILNIQIENFEIISRNDLIAKTSHGWLIYFNSGYSANSQVESLKLILDEISQDFEYIDLRIEGRAYYK